MNEFRDFLSEERVHGSFWLTSAKLASIKIIAPISWPMILRWFNIETSKKFELSLCYRERTTHQLFVSQYAYC